MVDTEEEPLFERTLPRFMMTSPIRRNAPPEGTSAISILLLLVVVGAPLRVSAPERVARPSQSGRVRPGEQAELVRGWWANLLPRFPHSRWKALRPGEATVPGPRRLSVRRHVCEPRFGSGMRIRLQAALMFDSRRVV